MRGQLRKDFQPPVETSDRDEELQRENCLKISIQEAKGIPDRRSYLCVLLVNGREKEQTTLKYKDRLCVWAEQFEIIESQEIRNIGILILREDKKRIAFGEFRPVIQNPKLDEWVKVNLEKPGKDKDKDDSAVRIRYMFRKVTILPLKEYKNFNKYLKQSSLGLCRRLETLLTATDKEDFMTSLVEVLQYNKKAVSFLNQLIISDVKQSDNNEVLFRANSMATKAIEVYMKLVGDDFLKSTLQEPITYLIHTTKEHEVDPSKVDTEFLPLEERQANLLESVEKVWSCILNSPKTFPAEIQEVFFAVRETLSNAESTNRLISASVFLRLLCPAVMSPHLFGLCKEYPKLGANRRLTLVAKTLQTLANFSTFQSKEDCMQFLNPFIEREKQNCKDFLVSISGPRPHELNGNSFQKDIYPGRHLALLHLQLKELLNANSAQIQLAADPELKELNKQLIHIDGCQVRYEKTSNRQQENLIKISTPFLYRSPPNIRRCISESQGRASSKRNDDLIPRNFDYNKALTQGGMRDGFGSKETSSNSFMSRKAAATDLSTSDNYVLQSALVTHRDPGGGNINVINNNNIEPTNLNQSTDDVTQDTNRQYAQENFPDLSNIPQETQIMTSRADIRQGTTPRHRALENSHSACLDPSLNYPLHDLDWNNEILSVTRDAENNMKASHSNLSQMSAKASSGYHSLSYSPSSSPIEHALMNNCCVTPLNSNNANPLFHVTNSPLSSSSSGVVLMTRASSPHDSPLHTKPAIKFRQSTPVKHPLYHTSTVHPTPPMTPPLNGKVPPYLAGNRTSNYSPEPQSLPNECLRRQIPLRRRSPSSSSSSSSPTSPTVRRSDQTLSRDVARSSSLVTPRTNPHCSPCRLNYPPSWRNSPTRRKSGSQAENSPRFMDVKDEEGNPTLSRESRSSWNAMPPQEDHMQAILQRLLTMEQEMRHEQDILLQEMNAKDRLLAEQERHIAALDTANSQLIRTIASLTATQSNEPRPKTTSSNQNNEHQGEQQCDVSLDSCTASDISDGKCSSC